ncbi:MAG TPA: MarR family transcriptional regulator [Candidatus Egerieimonas intestinavium]|uniref:MarR family transcriptional regulator n=1 Tax=Candidatus Egerieimonas intestinavium TaxID=2840777 RepID=A0A9D1JGI2_9FIRM|nr:MarR family transcriptional regulator [Candidatus Egerieimonas intestinavium]
MEGTFYMLMYRAFHAQRNYLRSYLGETGLGTGQPKLISYLDSRGPCRQRDLAEYFEIDRAAVSRMLDSLERGGFVTHQADENNRRADLVELTDKGREANRICQAHGREVEEAFVRGFSPEERERFAEYLSRAYQNIKEIRGEKL